MINSQNIAKYFLILAEKEYDENLSNMKLQKLLYYAQGFHLAMYDKPLFDNEIKAWRLGPVVNDVYQTYKHFGSKSIQVPESLDFEMEQEKAELLKEVFENYGQYSAWRLSEMTHDEKPWKSAAINTNISRDIMKSYFSSLIE